MRNSDALKMCALAYEKKLRELMGEKEYEEYLVALAIEIFRKDIEGLADGSFKDFCLENFDIITGANEDFRKLTEDVVDVLDGGE